MGTRADELKDDLERQRAALGYDLEAVGDRVSPGRMVERRRAAVGQAWLRARTRVMGSPDYAPNPAIDTGSSATGRVSEAAGSARDRVGDAAGTVKDQVTGAPQAVASATEGNPLAVGLMAFGAGLLAASLLPATDKERRVVTEQVKPVLDEARSEAQAVAKEAAEHLKPTAQDAASQVRDQAQGAAQTVSEQASSAKDQVRTDATQAADDVRGTVQGG
jgi:gas vesicle protein